MPWIDHCLPYLRCPCSPFLCVLLFLSAAALGDVEHNIKTLSMLHAENEAAHAPPPPQKEIVYAQPEAQEDDDDLPELRDEDEFEQDDRYMNSLD